MHYKGYRVELKPNNVQRTMLERHAGAARFVWNWALGRRIEEYEVTGRSSNYAAQNKQITELKKGELNWLYEIDANVPTQVLRDLDKAYKDFFRRVKNGEKPGFPKFKKKRNGYGGFRAKRCRVFEKHVQLPLIGMVRLKRKVYIPNSNGLIMVSVTERSGRWFVGVKYECEPSSEVATGKPIGVDLGVNSMVVTSNGAKYPNPKPLKAAQKKLRRAQRKLARRTKGGKNYAKQRKKVARIYERITNIRKDAIHKTTSSLLAKTKPVEERPSVVVIEDLSVKDMQKKKHIARLVADVGLYEFRRQLEYKAKWCGVSVIVVDRYFPSSKTCSNCGQINNKLQLSWRTWKCGCGVKHDRDVNAAVNLLNYMNTVRSTGIYAHGEDVRPASKTGRPRKGENQTSASAE